MPIPDYFTCNIGRIPSYNSILNKFTLVFKTNNGGVASDIYESSGLKLDNDEMSYAPPEMTEFAVWKGLSKYSHTSFQCSLTEMRVMLEWGDRAIGAFLEASRWSLERAWDELDDDKASGVYWRQTFGSKKGDIKSRFQPLDILAFSLTHTPVFSTSLKAELRQKILGVVKSARLFMPSPVELVLLGNWLFGAQNESLSRNVLRHPITIGLQIPGIQILKLFHSLESFGGKFVDSDGMAWDATFGYILTILCRELRKRHLDVGLHGYVDRYYDAVYASYVEVLGNVILVGNQKSGQTNTATDNSMGLVFLMCLAAYRKGWSYEEFVDNVLYYCNGDDLIFSSRDEGFDFMFVNTVFNSLGTFCDSESAHFKPFEACVYLGTMPAKRLVKTLICSQTVSLYKFRPEKIHSAFSWWKKGTSDDDHLSKLVALTILSYGDEIWFNKVRNFVLDWVRQRVESGVVFGSRRFASLMRFVVEPFNIFLLYVGSDLAVRPKEILVQLESGL